MDHQERELFFFIQEKCFSFRPFEFAGTHISNTLFFFLMSSYIIHIIVKYVTYNYQQN